MHRAVQFVLVLILRSYVIFTDKLFILYGKVLEMHVDIKICKHKTNLQHFEMLSCCSAIIRTCIFSQEDCLSS